MITPSIAQSEPGIQYDPWVPGGAGLYIDQNDQAWDVCSAWDENREPICPQQYIPLGPVRRISDSVVRTHRGTYFCRTDEMAKLNYPPATCTRQGWEIKECPKDSSGGLGFVPCVTGRFGEGGY